MSIIINKTLTVPIVSRETMEKLECYYYELTEWNKSISLMETLDKNTFFERHIYDALQICELLDKDKEIIDLGSGAGIPAIPLALSYFKVTMVESIKKKALFLNHMIKKLPIHDATLVNSRIENLYYDKSIIITARALTSLTNLINYMHNVSRETTGIFLKGVTIFDEIKDAKKIWCFDIIVYKSIGNGYVAEISNVKKR